MPTVDPVVLKTFGLLLLFGAGLLPLLHLLRRYMPLEVAVGPAALVSFGAIFGFFYRFDLDLYLVDFNRIVVGIGALQVVPLVAAFAFLGGGLGLAYLVSSRMTKALYRSFFHVAVGVFFLVLFFLTLDLFVLAVSIALILFVIAEYLRKTGDPGPLSRFAKTILTPALRDGEFEGYLASLFFLIGIFIVAVFLPYAYAGASIAVLTFADPSASFIGRRFGRTRWAHNPQKTREGTTAMVLVAFYAILALNFHPEMARSPIHPLAALLAAISVAIFESLPLKMGDNLLIPIIAGMVLLSGVSGAFLSGETTFWLYALPLFLALGTIAYFLGALDGLGAGVAVFFGILVFQSAGPPLLIALMAFLGIGFLLTKFRLEQKRLIPGWDATPAKPDGETRRTVNPVVANGLVPAFTGVLFLANPAGATALFSGALAAAAADTAAGEVGLLHPRPRLLTTRREVPPGTRGAISPWGTGAGLLVALGLGGLLALLLALWGRLPVAPWVVVAAAAIGGLVGTHMDSFLGATMSFLSKEEVNLFATLSGAGAAYVMWLAVGGG